MSYQAVIVDFRNTADHDADKAMAMLDDAELERIDWYRLPEQRLGMAVARCALRYALDQAGFITDTPFSVAKDPDGKPVHPSCHISLSHCDGIAAAAVGTGGPVGIDVELPREVSLDDFHSVLTPREWDYIHQGKPGLFFHLWTRKEAILKCMGTGFLISPETVEVLANPVSTPHGPMFWQTLPESGDATVSVACTRHDPKWAVGHFGLRELLELF